jgi:hypothetical protein
VTKFSNIYALETNWLGPDTKLALKGAHSKKERKRIYAEAKFRARDNALALRRSFLGITCPAACTALQRSVIALIHQHLKVINLDIAEPGKNSNEYDQAMDSLNQASAYYGQEYLSACSDPRIHS